MANAFALYEQALQTARQGDLENAEKLCRQSLAKKKGLAPALLLLGGIQRRKGKWEEALKSLNKSLSGLTDAMQLAEAYDGIGQVYLNARKDAEKAQGYFKKALEVAPNFVVAWNNLGSAFELSWQLDKALEAFEKADSLSPNNPQIRTNISTIQFKLHQSDKALGILKNTLEIAPGDPLVHLHYATILRDTGDSAKALDHFDRTIALMPQSPRGYWGKAFTLLLEGQYEQAWPLFESRRGLPGCTQRNFGKRPEWDGAPLDHETLLIYTEQGAGDTFQFARFITNTTTLVKNVVLECEPSLVALLSESFPSCTVVARPKDGISAPNIDFDYHIPLMSLPWRIGCANDLSLIAQSDKAYLTVPKASLDHWRQKVDPSRPAIGLAWAGNPIQPNDHNRSAHFDDLRSLLEIEGITFYNLQKGPAAEQIKPIADNLIDLGADFNDYSDTAAAISCLDLVISVDTSIAHLAGALQIPTWCAICYAPDWRYHRSVATAPWYPSTKLFRQSQPGQWQDVFTAIRKELKATPF